MIAHIKGRSTLSHTLGVQYSFLVGSSESPVAYDKAAGTLAGM